MSITSQKNFNLLKSILSKHPLVKVNKELLLEQLRNEIFEMDRNKEKYKNNLLSMNKKIIYNMTQFNPLSTIKIKQKEKLSNFDIRLKEHQEEFNNFNSKKPDEIDFRDKHENPKIS